MYRFFRKIWRHIAARLRRRTPRKPSNCRQHNLALRNYAPAPKYNAEFPECSRFRTHTHVAFGLSEPRLGPYRAFGPWGYSSSRINPATSRTSPRTARGDRCQDWGKLRMNGARILGNGRLVMGVIERQILERYFGGMIF